jgi:hypothetical protein
MPYLSQEGTHLDDVADDSGIAYQQSSINSSWLAKGRNSLVAEPMFPRSASKG